AASCTRWKASLSRSRRKLSVSQRTSCPSRQSSWRATAPISRPRRSRTMHANTSALREKSVGELEIEVKELREQLFKLRWQASMGQIQNPAKIREVRKAIARSLTVIGEMSRAGRGESR